MTQIKRLQEVSLLGAIDSLKDNAALTAFITENANGTVSTVRFAQLIQELYPVTIADDKIEEALSACTGIENMSEETREAYASFVSGTLAVDDSCKAGNQLITRGQALADYQMNYLAEHTQTQKAEVRQISGEDGTITLPAMSYTTFNKKWADSLAEQKEIQEELSQTTTQNQKKNDSDKNEN